MGAVAESQPGSEQTMLRVVALVWLAECAVAQQYQCDPSPAGLSDNCIGCICEASTNCNKTAKCISGDSFCGPFLISKGFWLDGGSCVLNNDSPTDLQPGRDVPWTWSALPTPSGPTSTGLARTAMVTSW